MVLVELTFRLKETNSPQNFIFVEVFQIVISSKRYHITDVAIVDMVRPESMIIAFSCIALAFSYRHGMLHEDSVKTSSVMNENGFATRSKLVQRFQFDRFPSHMNNKP